MGAKSTIDISRDAAIAFIEQHLDSLPNDAIARILEEVNDSVSEQDESSEHVESLGLHNFFVTGGVDGEVHPE